MSRFGIPAIAGIILLLAGIAHGLRSDRWGLHPDALAAAKKLSKVPSTIGKWHSSEVTIDQREITMAGALDYLSRKYVSRDNGRTVHVTILCGRHGPISVHPPTVCFVVAGWNLNDSPVKFLIQAGEHPQNKEFWMADFEKNSASMTYVMRTFWAWSVSGDWRAADHPRITYANSPFLYKIYISYSLTEAGEPIDESTKTFIERLLSEIDYTLFESGAD
jgi:hypothetical protein